MIINGYEIKPHANLKGANLEYAHLEGANLEGANLQGTYLYRANFQDANVTGTILEGKKEPQDDKDLKIEELEEENKKLKAALKALLDG